MVRHYYFLIALFIFGCQTSQNESLKGINSSDNTEQEEAQIDYPDFNWDTLSGLYFGDFAGSAIRIKINYASNKQVVGYNVHKGLLRNIAGNVEEKIDSVILHMDEPGDGPYDGTFRIAVNRENLKMNGNWVPFNKDLSSKSFKLKRSEFSYSDDDEVVITNDNFFNYYDYCTDTIGDFHFDADGMVRYQYYPTEDYEQRKEQMQEIKGSWMVKDKILIINWQPNPVFPTRKSTFEIYHEEYEYELRGEGRTIYSYYGVG